MIDPSYDLNLIAGWLFRRWWVRAGIVGAAIMYAGSFYLEDLYRRVRGL